MATRATYRTLIQGEVDDTSTASTTVVNNAIREGYQELISEIFPYIVGDTSEEKAVTSSTVTPVSTYSKITSIHYKSVGGTTWGKPLERITEKEYLDKFLDDTTTTPTRYLQRGNNIILVGSPTSGTLRIQGEVIFAELDDDTEVSLLPDRFSRVLVLFGIYRFKAYEDNPAANEYLSFYLDAKRTMLQQLNIKAQPIRPKLFGK